MSESPCMKANKPPRTVRKARKKTFIKKGALGRQRRVYARSLRRHKIEEIARSAKTDVGQSEIVTQTDFCEPPSHRTPYCPVVQDISSDEEGSDEGGNNDYGIQELRMEDSTDDEDEPRKEVPKWASGTNWCIFSLCLLPWYVFVIIIIVFIFRSGSR